MSELLLYGVCFFVVAFLYASVGHGGASGYLALMALFGFAPIVMKPTALLLNVMVSLVAFISFYKAKHFKSNLLWPLIIGSIPFAFIGAVMPISDALYKKILGVVLLISILRLIVSKSDQPIKPAPHWIILLLIGSAIGLVSGMIGMGGGILLSPILLLMGWSSLKQTAAISAIFIFLNSIAGIVGQLKTGFDLSSQILSIIAFVLIGGIAGAYFGAGKLPAKGMKFVLVLVLVMAATKLILVK